MKVKELLQNLDGSVPFSWAEDWDNSGMLLGDPLDDISGIAVSLDPSMTAVKMAAEKGCSVLVTHHPIIFNPLKKIVSSFSASGVAGSHENQSARAVGSSGFGSSGFGFSGTTTGSSPQEKRKIEISSRVNTVLTVFTVLSYILFIFASFFIDVQSYISTAYFR